MLAFSLRMADIDRKGAERVSLRLCTYPLFTLASSGLMQMIFNTRIYSSAECESAYIEWQRKGPECLYIIRKTGGLKILDLKNCKLTVTTSGKKKLP